MEYSALKDAAYSEGDRGFCGPLAIAALTGIPMKESLALCAAAGRKFKRGTYLSTVQVVLKQLGYSMTKVTSQLIIHRFPRGGEGFKNITTHQPARFPEAFKGLNLLLTTKSHFAAVVNGVTVDWSTNKSLRVRHIHLITKDSNPTSPLLESPTSN
jgi:hypothetical protein